MTDPNVYLAGPIRHATDPHTWRERAAAIAADHGATVTNPLDHTDYSWADAPPADVVQQDLDLLSRADAVVRQYLPHVQAEGTAMEMVYAQRYAVPAVVWNPNNADLSGWTTEHCDATCITLEDAVLEAIDNARRVRGEYVKDGPEKAVEEPYFWRYRENDPHAGEIDMCLMPHGDEKPHESKGNPGETTIIWWGDA